MALKSKMCPVFIAIMVAMVSTYFVACGDDASSELAAVGTEVADENILVVSDILELPNCSIENEGEQALVRGESSPRICIDEKWILVFADSSNSVDFSCQAEILSDKSGLKIICNGDSVGVVLNGMNGDMGQQGVQGEKGAKGDKGDAGEQGVKGEKGDKGDAGEQGIKGEKGDKGDTGEQGIKGEKGDKGDAGEQGVKGEKGDNGDAGEQGVKGEKGDKGDIGEQGIKGEKGDKGDIGEQGIKGEKGGKGDTGEQGIKGEKGDKGDAGEQGIKGEKGDKGDIGEQGIKGEKGDTGDSGTGCVIDRKWNLVTITCGSKSTVIDVTQLMVSYDLGSCTSVNEKEVGKSDNTFYICRSNKWIEASVLEYDTYGKVCSKDGAVVGGEENLTNKYVCDADSFRIANAVEVALNKGCVSYTDESGIWKQPSRDSVFICTEKTWHGFKGAYTKLGTFVDERDNRTYKTVVIGSQMWMAENLKYADSINYPSMLKRNFCYISKPCDMYGRLYTWAAAMDSVGTFSTNGKGCGVGSWNYDGTVWTNCSPKYPVRGICPEGWHLPTKEEWKTLIDAVGTYNYADKLLKSTRDWLDNGNGVDAYGFSVFPGGLAYKDGSYYKFNEWGNAANFWSSSMKNARDVYNVYFVANYNPGNSIYTSLDSYRGAAYGFSVRCVKNNCSAYNEGEVITIEGAYYTCHSDEWVESSVLEYDTYGKICFTDGAIVSGEVFPANKYVCDAGTFRTANATEIALEKGCVSYIEGANVRKRISVANDSIYTCQNGAWTGTSLFTYGTVKDARDNKTYRTTVIGTQTWMAENLNYADSAKYPVMKGRSSCYNDSCGKYGRLYTWGVAMDSVGKFSTNGKGCGRFWYPDDDKTCSPTYPVRGICPQGWHLPSVDEFRTLKNYVGESVGGKKLKSFTGWNSCNEGRYGTDDFGFSALPNGYRSNSTEKIYDGYAFFHSSTEETSILVWFMTLYYCNDGVGITNDLGRNVPHSKSSEHAVRCIKN